MTADRNPALGTNRTALQGCKVWQNEKQASLLLETTPVLPGAERIDFRNPHMLSLSNSWGKYGTQTPTKSSAAGMVQLTVLLAVKVFCGFFFSQLHPNMFQRCSSINYFTIRQVHACAPSLWQVGEKGTFCPANTSEAAATQAKLICQ